MISSANLASKGEEITGSSPIFQFQKSYGGDGLEDDLEGPANATPYIYIQSIKERAVHKVYLTTADDDESASIEKVFTLPHLCSKLSASYISGNSESTVGLTQNMRLYLNDKLFSIECTSFTLSQTFLAFVNSTSGLSHELYVYDLNKALPKPSNIGSSDHPKLASLLEDFGSFNVRAVERGSRLVTINGTRTVL